MTPIGHYAASALAGTLVMKLTGSPVIGGAVAFGAHIPLDFAFNEFWQWGEGYSKKLLFAVFMLPAMVVLGFATAISSSWMALLIMGLIGCLPDAIDAIVRKISGRRFMHWNTTVIMQSMAGTMLTESAFALVIFLIIFAFHL